VIADWLTAVGAGWLVVGLPWIAATTFALANIDTVRGTWSGEYGSSPTTWTIWAVLSGVALAAQLGLGGWTPAAALLVPITVICALVAGGALYRYRDAVPGVAWQWRVDVACALGAIASLALLLLSSGRTALVLTIVTDAIAAVPTVTMAWWPSREQPVPVAPYVSVGAAAICTLAAAPDDLWQWAYPGYLLLLGITMTVIILTRRRTLGPAEPVLDAALGADPLGLTPARPLRPPPQWPERTTDRMLPPWWRTPHADALARLVPADLLDRGAVSPSRFVAVMEDVYAAAHWAGWSARQRAQAVSPPRMPPRMPPHRGHAPAAPTPPQAPRSDRAVASRRP